MSIQKLHVHYRVRPTEEFQIGTLALQRGRLFFEYSESFLQNPHWLSPYHLSPTRSFHEFQPSSGLEIWGLFDDSLPDGWGLLLMDRFFRKTGVHPRSLSILDRLAYLGTRTMGALTYHPSSQTTAEEQKMIDLFKTSQEVFQVLDGKAEDILDDLFRLGGSPGGARPKILVGRKDDYLISGVEDLPEDFEHWLLKFHAKKDEPEEGILEQIYAEIAREAGLEMPKTDLFFEPTQGLYFFGVQRFDRRIGNERLHIHSFGNLIHSNFRYPSQDYSDLLERTRDLTKNQECVEKVFRQMVFNILMNNRDDHDKNFAFKYDQALQEWSYTPSYDLTYCYGLGRTGEHSMMVAGEGANPALAHVMKLAKDQGISKKRATEIIEQVKHGASLWVHFSRNYDLSKNKEKEIGKDLQKNLLRF